MPDVIREATDSAATAGNPAPANATTQANRAQSASPAGPSPAGAPLTWRLKFRPTETEHGFLYACGHEEAYDIAGLYDPNRENAKCSDCDFAGVRG